MPSRPMRLVNYLFLIVLALIGRIVFPALRYTLLPVLLAVALVDVVLVDVVLGTWRSGRRRPGSPTRRTPRMAAPSAAKLGVESDGGARSRRPTRNPQTDRQRSSQIVRCDHDCGSTAQLRCDHCEHANPYADVLCGFELNEARLRERLN